MKRYFEKTMVSLMLLVAVAVGCSDDFPTDEDGLLITDRAACYVSSFDLLGSDFQSVVSKAPVVDTVAQTVTVEVVFGTDLKNLWPQFTLVTDAKLNPKITERVDFSDLSNPKQYTVISGNRKVNKIYTVNLSVQP